MDALVEEALGEQAEVAAVAQLPLSVELVEGYVFMSIYLIARRM